MNSCFRVRIIALALALATQVVQAQDEPYDDWLEGYRHHLREAKLEGRPLDPVERLHPTGRARAVDAGTWQLVLRGGAMGPRVVSVGYADLLSMAQVDRKALLVCPGVFEDYAEWEGVPLRDVLDRAGAGQTYQSILVRGLDGYEAVFSRQEVDEHLIMLATRVNGQVLPAEHGYPTRIVAEYLLGGRWVKWVSEIIVE